MNFLEEGDLYFKVSSGNKPCFPKPVFNAGWGLISKANTRLYFEIYYDQLQNAFL